MFDPYIWAVVTTGLSVLFGFAIHQGVLWRYRRIGSALSSCLIGISTGLLIVSVSQWVAVLIFFVQSYRLFSALRIVKNRVNSDQLHRKTIRSELILGSWLAVFLLIDAHLLHQVSVEQALVSVIGTQLVIGAVLYRHVRMMRISTQAVVPKKFLADSELPTITVAIPARNETNELADCLQNILRTNYPKLEVLVLDDCSQDRTSDIIRKFAHRGVRFLQGSPPPTSWIAKNHAYSQLLEEASGEYILFCGTDVRFEINSLRQLTEIMLQKHVNMLSVLPRRDGEIDKHFLLQPMRYWNELAIPHIRDRTPPVLSTCWMAKRTMLVQHGGFRALRKAIRPERQIARGVAKEGHYAFLRASSGLGISSIKTLPGQWATAVRTRYPEHHNQPEAIYFTSLWHAVILLGPITTTALSIWYGYAILAALSVLALFYILATHYYVNEMTTEKKSFTPFLLFPTSVLLEVIVINYSMWAYEFSEVIWKGRNVCLPVLKTNLRLPKLD